MIIDNFFLILKIKLLVLKIKIKKNVLYNSLNFIKTINYVKIINF